MCGLVYFILVYFMHKLARCSATCTFTNVIFTMLYFIVLKIKNNLPLIFSGQTEYSAYEKNSFICLIHRQSRFHLTRRRVNHAHFIGGGVCIHCVGCHIPDLSNRVHDDPTASAV